MSLKATLVNLANLGARLQYDKEENDVIERTYVKNRWFTPEQVEHMLNAIHQDFLSKERLEAFATNYELPETSGKTIGVVMAGNIPLVGFHDLLSVLLSGSKAQVKLSSRDPYLLPWVQQNLAEIDPRLAERVEFVDKLGAFDGVIATGSNNSGRYFKEYFGKYPHIIRRNRGSVAILDGSETEEQLKGLGEDIFRYFGLGCRNVSKLYVPEGYNFRPFFEAIEDWKWVADHERYRNNFDYHLSIFLLNKVEYLTNDFLLVSKGERIVSPIGSINYEEYADIKEVDKALADSADDIQCVVSAREGDIAFGNTQHPGLADFADHVDTIKFVLDI